METLKPVVGTFNQYFLNGDTFNHVYLTFCTVLEVIVIIIKYKFINFDIIFFGGKKKKKQTKTKKQLSILQEMYMYCDIHYETQLNIRCTVENFETCSWYIQSVLY